MKNRYILKKDNASSGFWFINRTNLAIAWVFGRTKVTIVQSLIIAQQFFGWDEKFIEIAFSKFLTP